ncbi:hypothetical protein [Streptomyces sp. NPDC006289]|uniref:hypothetical protein n=1 Tax=Streptomyces sp. NPDC006289 TaxID=3156744 RepID=UPI0033BC0BD4
MKCAEWWTVVILASISVSGCGVQGKRGTAADMNMQEAAEHADAMLDETFAAIEPEVNWAHGQTLSGSCDVTRSRTVLTVISEQRRGNFLGVIERLWKKNGYDIYSIRKSKDFPALFANSPDGFGVSLVIGDKGQAHFDVDSPCVEKSEVAEPTAKPNGPAYEGVEIPRPNVRSDFWSADTPVPSPAPVDG